MRSGVHSVGRIHSRAFSALARFPKIGPIFTTQCLALGVEGGASWVQPHRDLLGNMENGARACLD